MNLRERAERLGRALGVWWDPAKRNGAMSGLVVTDREATPGMRQLLVQTNVTLDSTWAADAWTLVDARTLALILLGHHRDLRVDLGECTDCKGTREQTKTHGFAFEDGWSPRLTTGQAIELWRPCPACSVDGQPTGRHTVPWPDAILAAMPKTSWVHRDGATFGPFESAGDRATRDALGVLADHMQANPDPCAFCRGRRWGYMVDKIGPGVTIEEMNPRREICMICEGSGVDEHGAHKVQIGQCLAAWLCGALADLDGVLERLVGEASVNAE